jgi:transcription antitermination factor NusG
MPYWCAARAQPQREALAQHFLEQAGYAVYLPRLRAHRVSQGRKIEIRPPLFPGYLFIQVVVGWWQARWCPGTLGLVMNCGLPVRVPEAVLAEIRKRETGGLVDLPRPPKFRPGARVKVLHGPFIGHIGLYAGMKPHERVAVLLAILGGSQRVTLAADAVEQAP